MGMTAVEKVLALKSGQARVRPGDVVYPDPDFIMIHDGVVMGAKRELDALGIDRLAAPGKVLMVTDHDVIYGSARAAERGAFNRKAAAQWGVTHFYDVGRGGHGHIFPMETGMLLPGMFYFDNDRHATNAGAIGAFGFRMGGEISRVLATGTNWVMTPKSVRLRIEGRLRPGVHARDLGFHIASRLHTGALGFDLDYRVLEYAGELEPFDLAARVALCSSPTEMRAYGVFVPPSQAILERAQACAQRPFTPIFGDADAQYEAEARLDVSHLEPQIALPGGVQNAVNLSEVAGTPVDHAFLGSCGSSMYEDLAEAARILRGRRHRRQSAVLHRAGFRALHAAPHRRRTDAGVPRCGGGAAAGGMRAVQRCSGRPGALGRGVDFDRRQQQRRPLRRARCQALSRQPGDRRGIRHRW